MREEYSFISAFGIGLLGLWIFYAKSYQALKFNIIEKGGDCRYLKFYDYYSKLNHLSAKDFIFISRSATTSEGKKAKTLANLLLLLFYIDLILLIFLNDLAEYFK